MTLFDRPIRGGHLDPVIIANDDNYPVPIATPEGIPISVSTPEGSPISTDVRFIDQNGDPYGIKQIDGKPRISSMDYLYDIAEGHIPGHESFSKFGFTPTMTTAISDIWSAAGVYVLPVAEQQMEVVSSNNVDDIGTSIFSGTSDGGSTTSLIDTTKNFTAGTPVAVGDCVILEKAGASPEYGFVTAIAVTELTVASGFSQGGSGSGRTYNVVDYSATAGIHAVELSYLDGDYVEKREIIIINGTTEVATGNTDIFRVQKIHAVATGSNGRNTGNVDIRNLANTPVYARITALYNLSRSSMFTVPAGKTLYVTSLTLSFGYAANQTHYARLFAVSTRDDNGFNNLQPMRMYFPFAEVIVANTSQLIEFSMPEVFTEKTEIKVRGISTFAGVASSVMRGWIEE